MNVASVGGNSGNVWLLSLSAHTVMCGQCGSAVRFTAVRTGDGITWRRSVPKYKKCGNCGYKFMSALQQSMIATDTMFTDLTLPRQLFGKNAYTEWQGNATDGLSR